MKAQGYLRGLHLQLLQKHHQRGAELPVSGGIQQKLHGWRQENCAGNTFSGWKVSSENLILV